MWANPTEYGLLGYTAAEYIGRRIADFHVDANVATDIQERWDGARRWRITRSACGARTARFAISW